MGINQGKATAICLFYAGDGYSLNVSSPLKQLASFHRVDSLTVAEACEHVSSVCVRGECVCVCACVCVCVWTAERCASFVCLFKAGSVGGTCGAGHCYDVCMHMFERARACVCVCVCSFLLNVTVNLPV